MLYEEVTDADEISADDLRERYEDAIADAVAEVGTDAAASETDVDRERVRALAADESPTLTVAEAASLAALADGQPDAETTLVEVRDTLMLEMSSAVLDVDAIASDLDADLEPRTIQRKIEGRESMTLAEYALIRRYVASELSH